MSRNHQPSFLHDPAGMWGIRGKMNAIPGWFRTVFRDNLEQDSGMKVNTGAAMKPNSFRQIRNRVRLPRNYFHRHVVALDNIMAGSLPFEREDQLASQKIVRAQDQRSSSIEV